MVDWLLGWNKQQNKKNQDDNLEDIQQQDDK